MNHKLVNYLLVSLVFSNAIGLTVKGGLGNGESKKRESSSDVFVHCEKERDGLDLKLPGKMHWAQKQETKARYWCQLCK